MIVTHIMSILKVLTASCIVRQNIEPENTFADVSFSILVAKNCR